MALENVTRSDLTGDQSPLQVEIASLRNRLRNEERFHARLLDAVQEAVIATDLAGRVIFWNCFAEQLYGWSAAEAMGRNVLELIGAPGVAAARSEVTVASAKWRDVDRRTDSSAPRWLDLSSPRKRRTHSGWPGQNCWHRRHFLRRHTS
jgi:PAS domain-containing protein